MDPIVALLIGLVVGIALGALIGWLAGRFLGLSRRAAGAVATDPAVLEAQHLAAVAEIRA